VFCSGCGTELGTNVTCSVCGRPAQYTTLEGRGIDPELHVPLSGWWHRVGATIIDGLVLIVPTLFVGAFISSSTSSLLAGSLVGMGYQVFLLSSHRGQTVGNIAVKTRVLRAIPSESPVALGLGQSFLRWAYAGVPTVIVTLLVGHKFNDALSYIQNLQQSGAIVTVNDLPQWVRTDLTDTVSAFGLLLLYLLADQLSPLWTRRRQTLHDMVARTIVVRTDI